MDENAEIDWDEMIPVYHYWREIPSGDYYFDIPNEGSVQEWMELCEERNPRDTVARRYVQGYCANMNQYVTVNDFYELWYHDKSYLLDDDLTTWRLMQYDSTYVTPPDSEFDKFNSLKFLIQGLLLYEPQSQLELNLHSSLECDFQEYYVRLLVREAKKHTNRPELAMALEQEQTAWLNYQDAVGSAFRVIDGDPDGMVGSAWPMAICGILLDNARMRVMSLEDFYFSLTDSLDYQYSHKWSMVGEYEIERHARVRNNRVLEEYHRFMDSFKDETLFGHEFGYPEAEMKSVLMKEMEAWKAWMSSRDKTSSLLTGLCKECYDNATNNVRRFKLIMLKNRYQGFGITSESVMDCLLHYDCQDSEIDTFSYEEAWHAINYDE